MHNTSERKLFGIENTTRMINNVSNDSPKSEAVVKSQQQKLKIQAAQANIYQFLLEIVREWAPEEVLQEFRRLFIDHLESISSDSVQAIYEIIFANDEEEFCNTVKRSCYILINNWESTRRHKYIQQLVEIFPRTSINQRQTASLTIIRLRQWLTNFVNSPDYAELQLFAAKYEDQYTGHWVNRYTSYLLASQYIDPNNPIEQREAAKLRAIQLKNQFKFELAMYIAHSQSAPTSYHRQFKNPTILGDEVLRLIKSIVVKKGVFSYDNIANIFLKQTENQIYREFKRSLQKYLIFSVQNQKFIEKIKWQLSDKLESLYEQHHDETINDALLLRTCNRVINFLTTENRREPSQLFILLISQGNPLTLVIILLKIVLICKNSRSHLEASIGDLIRYYERYPDEDCSWMINFLEIFNITFAIYAENVEYNLIKMHPDDAGVGIAPALDEYRVFSQMKEVEYGEEMPEHDREITSPF